MLEIIDKNGFFGEQFLPGGEDRTPGEQQFQIAQGSVVEIAPERAEEFVANGPEQMGLAGPVRAAEHQQARGFADVVERRRTAMRGPVDGAPGDVAGKAQGPFVLPVADERVEGPFFPKRHRVGHGGMEGVLPAFGSGLDEGTGGDGVNFPAPYVMESPFPQSSRAFFSNSFWNRLEKRMPKKAWGKRTASVPAS